jgi:hypothetical protein
MKKKRKKMKNKKKRIHFAIFFFCALNFCLFPGSVHCKNQPDLGVYKAIVARDPFDPERGSNWDESYSTSLTSGEEFKEKHQLYGTLVSETLSLAYIKTVDPKKRYPKKNSKEDIRRVAMGDIVDGWRVKTITGKEVEFASGKEMVMLQMYEGEKPERMAASPVALQTSPSKSAAKDKKAVKKSTPSALNKTMPFQPMGMPNGRETGTSGSFRTREMQKKALEELRERRRGNLPESILKRLKKNE